MLAKSLVLEIFNVARRKENRFLSEDQIFAVESQKYCSPHPFPGASDNNFRTSSAMLKNTISENLRMEQMQIEIDCQFIVDLSFMKFSAATTFRLMCVSRTFFNREKRLCCRRFNRRWGSTEQEKKYL